MLHMVYPRIMSTDLDDLTCKMDRQEDLGEDTSLMPCRISRV
jgi:hypothetical protein